MVMNVHTIVVTTPVRAAKPTTRRGRIDRAPASCRPRSRAAPPEKPVGATSPTSRRARIALPAPNDAIVVIGTDTLLAIRPRSLVGP
jgi:hypothetical protein